MALYQDIMKVPGLTGTWQQRNKDLYYKLGAPLGSYSGNYKQNMWLLNQLQKNNYFAGGLPGAKPKTAATPVDPRQAISDATLKNVKPVGNFQDIMPESKWNQPFDEWTRNYVKDYMEPEWRRNVYEPAMKEAQAQLEKLNNKIGGSGNYMSGASSRDLNDASNQILRQEEQMRQDYQDKVQSLRDQVRTTWSDPLYESQMKRYENSPWADVKGVAGSEIAKTIGNLNSQYGVGGQNINSLMDSLKNWNPDLNTSPINNYDWRVPGMDTSKIQQYLTGNNPTNSGTTSLVNQYKPYL